MRLSVRFAAIAFSALLVAPLPAADETAYDPVAEAAKALVAMHDKPTDSPQMGLSHFRNNVSGAKNIPTQWDVMSGKNIKWSAKLGSQTYATPVIANGKVFQGTNNANGYVKRYPSKIDLG